MLLRNLIPVTLTSQRIVTRSSDGERKRAFVTTSSIALVIWEAMEK
jgi:hypothetical protein